MHTTLLQGQASGSAKCSRKHVLMGARSRLTPQQRHGGTFTAWQVAHHARSSPSRRAVGRLSAHARYTVADVMTAGPIYTCHPDDTIDSALEKLVEFRVTGLPVMDDTGKVVGVVSDYDLLALDKLGRVANDKALFPEAEQTWQAFKEVKILLSKSGGKKIRDVMTSTPIIVAPDLDLDEAARLLLSKKIHRLPVVDGAGNLVGIISRGNIVKAALAMRNEAKANAA